MPTIYLLQIATKILFAITQNLIFMCYFETLFRFEAKKITL